MQIESLQMKRALRTALLVLLLSAMGMGKGYAWGDFTYGGVRYYGFQDGTAMVEGLVNGFSMQSLTIPRIVTADEDYTVTDIHSFGEVDNTTLVTIHLPNTITGINENAFNNLAVLSNIFVDSYAFSRFIDIDGVLIDQEEHTLVAYPRGRMGEYEIPNSIVTIGNMAFYGCDALSSIVIPNSVTSIGCAAFYQCSGLSTVTIPNSVTSIGTDEVCYIGGHTFFGCTGLTSIDIASSVTAIGGSCFEGCTSLLSITIPSSIDTIEGSAFKDCTSLMGINFDAINCTYMGSSDFPLFAGCSSLRTLNIGEQVQTIPDYAFYQLNTIEELVIPNSIMTIGKSAFYGCTGLTSVTIGNLVTSIGEAAFRNCPSLTSITIPNSVLTIGKSAFYGCTGLTSVTIGNSVTSIEEAAFSRCSGLTSFTIPKSMTSIGWNAFAGCSRLTTVYFNAENAEGSTVFNDCSNLTTLHIGPDVQEINSYMFSGCTGVHLVVALGPTPATLQGGAFSDIADNSILMVSCGKRLTYYSVWNMFDFNNIIEDCGEYAIDLNGIGAGGSVSASSNQAQMGQTVTLTVMPNSGMMLSSISVANATDPTQIIPITPVGKASSIYSFVMPPFGVKVYATFMAGTSVGEYESIEANVYPNPTNGQVKIEAEDLKHLIISNMFGQVIYQGKASGNEFVYNFRQQSEGVYLIRIETANGVVTKRVAVTR